MKRVASLGAVVAIQAAGSLATLASVLLIARQRGAEIQGSFGLVKAEIDLLVAVLLIGMPQAIFYFLNRGSLNWQEIRRLTAMHASFAGLAAIVFVAYRHGSGMASLEQAGTFAVGLAVAALVGHGNLRGGLLETRSSLVFSLITALPGACLLIAVMVALPAGGMSSRSAASIAPVLAISYCIACFVTILVAHPAWTTSSEVRQSPGVPALGRYGLATWIPAVAQNLSPVIALTWIDRRIGDPVGLGVFSAAVMSLNLILTPLAMLVPLLFKRWVGLDESDRRRDLGRVLRPMAVLCLGFALVTLLAEKPVVQQVFGSDYVSRGGIFALLALGIWPQTATRLFGVLFSSAGRPWLSLVGELTRVSALVIGLFAFQVRDLTMLACVWVAAEFVSPTASWLLMRRDKTSASGGRATV